MLFVSLIFLVLPRKIKEARRLILCAVKEGTLSSVVSFMRRKNKSLLYPLKEGPRKRKQEDKGHKKQEGFEGIREVCEGKDKGFA